MKKLSELYLESFDSNPGNSLDCIGVSNHYTPINNILIVDSVDSSVESALVVEVKPKVKRMAKTNAVMPSVSFEFIFFSFCSFCKIFLYYNNLK